MSRYLELLEASSKRVGSSLCVGIDPEPSALPARFATTVAAVGDWVSLLIRATSGAAAAYKVNLAFFEALGAEGIAAAEKIRAQVGKGRGICGLSGGVDSAVAASIITPATSRWTLLAVPLRFLSPHEKTKFSADSLPSGSTSKTWPAASPRFSSK